MDNVTLKKWSNFKYETKKEQKVLLEVEQYIVDKFQGAVERAENGELQTFTEIFGKGTSEDPKLRMLMPYGTDDVEKFKVILEFLRNAEYVRIMQTLEKQHNEASPEEKSTVYNYMDLMVLSPGYICTKQTVQVQKKPLGWVQGDPIPTVDVDTATISLNYRYKTFKSGDRTIEANQPVFKLLKQFAPEEVTWWQGDKKNNISGRQTFFTNNFQVTDQIIKGVNKRRLEYLYTSYKEQLEKESNTLVMISRHPIDVLRMSDFSEAGIRSCHSPGADYFSNCQQEVASGGAIIFTVDKSKFLELFPDSIIPQKGEIFSDKDRRGIKIQRYQDPNKPMSFSDVKFAPKARLRLRRVEHADDVSFAVPDTRIYGEQMASFRTQTFKYFGEMQKDKFVLPDGKPYLPDQDSLMRYGGQYEDGGDQNVGSNFALLARTAMIYGGVDKSFFESSEWREYKQRLEYDSIQFGGGDPDEFDEDEDHTDELDRAASRLFREYARKFTNFSDGTVNVEPFYDYEVHELNTIQVGLSIDISVMMNPDYIIDSDRFRNLDSMAVRYLKNENILGGGSMSWPSLDLADVYTDGNRIIFLYRGTYDVEWNNRRNQADTGDLDNILEDFNKFLDEYCGDAGSLAEDILRALRNLEIAQPSARDIYKAEIEEIENLVSENDEYFTLENRPSKDTIIYQKNLFTISSEGKGYSNDMSLVEYKSEWIFKDLMKKNKDRIKKEVAQQLTLFSDIPSDLNMPAIFKSLDYLVYEGRLILSAERTSAGESIGTSSEKIRINVSIRLKVVIDEQLEEENVQAAVGFVLALLNDQTTIDQIAVDTYKQALVNTSFEDYVTRIAETKKQRFKRLMREYAIKRRKGLV
jgi:hypothetical protein